MFTDYRFRPLSFAELDTGCFVCVSHKANTDGYFRWNTGNRTLKMFHRIIWELHNGPIPNGYEINHICGNRSCQNVSHMECISGHEHTIKTNVDRYSKRKECARVYWEETKCSGTQLGSIFFVSVSSACKWIRDWSETH